MIGVAVAIARPRLVVFTVHEPPNAPADRLERAEQLVFVKDGFSLARRAVAAAVAAVQAACGSSSPSIVGGRRCSSGVGARSARAPSRLGQRSLLLIAADRVRLRGGRASTALALERARLARVGTVERPQPRRLRAPLLRGLAADAADDPAATADRRRCRAARCRLVGRRPLRRGQGCASRAGVSAVGAKA